MQVPGELCDNIKPSHVVIAISDLILSVPKYPTVVFQLNVHGPEKILVPPPEGTKAQWHFLERHTPLVDELK
jgi:hypothetical protein